MAASYQERLVWRRKAAAIVPLLIVIVAALIWSGFATFHHAMGPIQPNGEHRVPAEIAWTLIAALDGSVLVTTPIWLSTVLPSRVRRYAGTICCGALGGSMLVNGLETGWPGVFPPLIAGLLIHLVGVVLRAFAKLEKDCFKPEKQKEKAVPEKSLAPKVVRPVLVDQLRPKELVVRMLNEAYAKGEKEPSGSDLTAAVRKAGHTVNDNYGRTTKAVWKKERASQEQAAVHG